MKKIRKRFLALAMVTLSLALTLTTAPAQAFAASEVYAAASYDSGELAQYALEVAILVNRERAAQGLSPLKLSDKLSEAANLRVVEIQTKFAHTRPNGESCFTVLDEAGIDYYYAGENIAYGQKTPEAVMAAWMNSAGHKANILSETPQYLGVGVTYANGRYYWAQFFAYANNLDGIVPTDPKTSVTITAQPQDFTGKAGSTASFTVKASGEGLSYQWQLSDDQGKTWRNSSVKTANYAATLTAANHGRYVRCLVTDQSGNQAVSDAASMKIDGPVITVQPSSVTAKNNAWITFRVQADGDGLTYQWQLSDDFGKTWRNSSTKAAVYATTLTTTNNNRYVRCIVTDKAGKKATSNAAYMKVTSLQITGQPTAVTALNGDLVSFRVTAKGPGLTYQWQLSDDQGKTWRNSSTRAANYTTTLSSKNSGRYLRCIVTDKYGNSVKSNATYMKISSLNITGQPANAEGRKGEPVSFTVSAKGPGLTYQWQLSDNQGKTWRNSSNQTANYSTNLSDLNNGRYLRCIVADKYGNKLISDAASMKIVSSVTTTTTAAPTKATTTTSKTTTTTSKATTTTSKATTTTTKATTTTSKATTTTTKATTTTSKAITTTTKATTTTTKATTTTTKATTTTTKKPTTTSTTATTTTTTQKPTTTTTTAVQTVGVNTATHSQAQIKKYLANSSINLSSKITYAKEPVVSGDYDAGRLSDTSLNEALDTLNAMRYIAGLDDNVTLDDTYTAYCQAGALVNYVNDELSHYPSQPADMSDELYNLGAIGSRSSNIAWASWQHANLPYMIVRQWIYDSDSYNISALGHRRWLLNPAMGKTGFGSVTGSNGTYGQVYAFDRSNSSGVTTVVWPAQQMPTEYFPANSAWSISSSTAFSSDASVKLVRTRNGETTTWNFSSGAADGEFYTNSQGYGMRYCLIFRPAGVGSYQAGDSFAVYVTENGTVTKSYPVNFFSVG